MTSSLITTSDIPGGATSYIQLTSSLQSGATFFVSSGTVNNLNVPNTKYFVSGFQMLPILQIQTYTTQTNTVLTSTTFQNTALQGSFTPKTSSSKIIIAAFGDCSQNVGDSGAVTIARDGTNLAADSSGFHRTVSNNNYHTAMIVYDSPGTTSAVTYSVQIRTDGGGGSIEFPPDVGGTVAQAYMIAIEIAQ